MKIENGKIVEATVSELWEHWYTHKLFDLYSFDYYKWLCQDRGLKIIGKEVRDEN